MATIKEKAKKHSLEPRANAHCGYDEEDLENSFEVGANYVLNEIDPLINLLHGGVRVLFEEKIKELKGE